MLFRARKKELLGHGQWHEQNKDSKVLEASELRAFNKVYIIDNQWFINIIVELMCCFELRNTVPTETVAAKATGQEKSTRGESKCPRTGRNDQGGRWPGGVAGGQSEVATLSAGEHKEKEARGATGRAQ
ncbi:hypothetical protein GCM10027434_42450 [Hymenobacter luteus]